MPIQRLKSVTQSLTQRLQKQPKPDVMPAPRPDVACDEWTLTDEEERAIDASTEKLRAQLSQQS